MTWRMAIVVRSFADARRFCSCDCARKEIASEHRASNPFLHLVGFGGRHGHCANRSTGCPIQATLGAATSNQRAFFRYVPGFSRSFSAALVHEI